MAQTFRSDGDHLNQSRLVPTDAALADVRIGEQLAGPIFDEEGVLLLARGAVISQPIADLLRQRRIPSVLVFREPQAEPPKAAIPSPTRKTREVLMKQVTDSKLRSSVESELSYIGNSGTSIAEQLNACNRGSWNAEFVRQIEEEIDSFANLLGEMFARDWKSASQIDGSVMWRIANGVTTLLLTDLDAALGTVLLQVRQTPREIDFAGHLSRHVAYLAFLSQAIAIHCGLNAENVNRIGTAALVHDWGFVEVNSQVRKSVLSAAPVVLTEADEIELRKHPLITRRILERVSGLPPMVMRTVMQVHERPDGSGYPRGEAGSNLHLFPRIIGTADTLLMRIGGYFGNAMPGYAAIAAMLRETAAEKLDAKAMRGLLHAVSTFPLSSEVRLSDGRVGRVIRTDGDKFTLPIVELAEDGSVVDLANSNLRIASDASAAPIPKPHFQRSHAATFAS